MTKEELIQSVKNQPDNIEFNEALQVINENYQYTPARFTNGSGDGQVINEAGTNEGSCKIFAFASLNQLNPNETLALFGRYYREDVLQHPENTDHANIRNFIRYGWDGISFDTMPLKMKG